MTATAAQVTKPVKALIIQQISKDPFARGNGASFIVTEHKIHQRPGDAVPMIGAGKALSKAGCRRVATQLAGIGERPDDGAPVFLPDNLLVASKSILCWHEPSKVRPMWFIEAGTSVSVKWPHLVFVASERGLRVFAMLGNKRPTTETKLYHAPLMNIYGDGRLCFGSAVCPDRITVDSIPEWNAAIFDSRFSHVNHDRTIKGAVTSTEHARWWRDRNGQDKALKASDLVRIKNLTLADVLSGGRRRG
jgi:PRTRC genetic system protein B